MPPGGRLQAACAPGRWSGGIASHLRERCEVMVICAALAAAERLGACGDWGGIARVETAYKSGRDLAQAILGAMGRGSPPARARAE